MAVDRCVCKDVSFHALREMAREVGAGEAGTSPDVVEFAYEDLQRRTGCGTGCGMCEGYIRLMLACGRARFAAMSRPGSR